MAKPGGGRLARFVRRKMEEKGMTFEDVARNCELHASYVHNLASGKSRNPSALKLVAAAKGLGVNPHELFDVAAGIRGGAAGESSGPELPDVVSVLEVMQRVVVNPGLMEMVEQAVTLSPEMQRTLAEVAGDLKRRQSDREEKSRRKGRRATA